MASKIASTISTGGGGTEFERHVGAYFLALLLTKSFCPIFSESAPMKVHFQARRLGWEIEDLVVEVSNEAGEQRRICVQAKRTFTVSDSDDECVATVIAAWKDFNNSGKFDQERDALVLATYLGTNRIQFDLRWLLDQARARASSKDFGLCLSGEGILNKKSKGDYDSFKSIIEKHEGVSVTEDRIWRFLRAFYVLSFDFLDSAGKDEASIKTVLAALRSKDAPIDVAATTWAELIKFSGEAALQGRSVEMSMLPEDMRRRHDQVASSKHGELARLRSHSSVVLRRVTDAGPRGLVFDRSEYRENIESAFASNQIVLIVGSAGCGKSALAKKFLANAERSESVFSFSSEEFKGPHINGVLANANIGLVWQELLGLLPLHRKIFLVESLERLLEANDRAAFNDLLLVAKDDPSISLVFTCRDYYAEIVERSFLVPSGVAFGRVAIGGLTDAELVQAADAAPQIKPLIGKPALIPLLRNPFVLAKAAELDWSSTEPYPNTERALRKCLWGEVVRREAFTADSMPAKRESLFFRICVDRARALQPFVPMVNTDGALDALANDNLVSFNDNHNRVAAAHDVLEDWGLAEWLARQFEEHDYTVMGMLGAVGDHPALRRAYRKWLMEQLDEDSDCLLSYVKEVSAEKNIPAHFRDDTLLAIFQSVAAANFLTNFKAQLLEAECALMLRVMDLVRVGCKTVDPRSKSLDVTSQWHIPSGRAWSVLLRFMAENWSEISALNEVQVVHFIEDWTSGVGIDLPYPEGWESAGWLIGAMLGRVAERGPVRASRHRLIELLMKIPKANPTLFVDLCQRSEAMVSRLEDEDASYFSTELFKPFKSMPAARDFPIEITRLCSELCFLNLEIEEQDYYSLREVDCVFGLKHSYEHRLFPASALQGPFFSLLRFNHAVGVPFIVEFLNKACSRYAELAQKLRIIEAPFEVNLILADGSSKKVFTNDRLWRAYRATSVTPDVIECALMALEKWFFDSIEAGAQAEAVQSWLDFILHKSNNAATLAVVASVCTGRPAFAGSCGVSILGCPEFIRLDMVRMATEDSSMAPGGFDGYSKMFQKERVASNALPHRKKSLEDLAVELQFGNQVEEVHKLLDVYIAELPPETQRTRAETEWMLALQRMDIRTYEEMPVEGGITFRMGKLPSDVAQMIQESEPQQKRFLEVIRLRNWSRKQFEKPNDIGVADWNANLSLAKLIDSDSAAYEQILLGGLPITASVLARDCWNLMEATDQNWCKAVISNCMNRFPNVEDTDLYHGSIPVDGSLECATAMGAILSKLSRVEAEALLLASLGHHNSHVRSAAVTSMPDLLPAGNSDLFNYGVRAIIELSKICAFVNQQVMKLSYNTRPTYGQICKQIRDEMALKEKSSWGNPLPALDEMLLVSNSELASDLIKVFRSLPDDALGCQLFDWVARQFGSWWSDRTGTRQHNHNLEFESRSAFAGFLILSKQAEASALVAHILPLVDTNPREISELLEELIVAADHKQLALPFWRCWAPIAQKVLSAKWIGTLGARSNGEELIRKLFLNTQWSPSVREWSCLEDRFRSIDELFGALPAETVVLESYLHYLMHVGRPSMPQALVHLRGKFGLRLEHVLKKSTASKTWLDQLVSRAMFENYPELQKPPLRDAVLGILDVLVQAGSSNAFLLREDFVTPTGGANR